jgi:serine/threonine-protein kinase RsbW
MSRAMSVGDSHHRTNGKPRKSVRAASSMRSINLIIPSDRIAGRDAEDRILKAVDEIGFGPHSAFAVKLSLQEALTNAIKHGNRLDPGKKVHIHVTLSKRQIAIEIEDEGPGFARCDIPDPRAEENLEKCSGRGIFLIESYMDSVEWSHGGRRLRMVRKNQEDGPHPP